VPTIAKYLAANYKLPDNFKKILSTQLKILVKSEKLIKTKSSYKLGEAAAPASVGVPSKPPPHTLVGLNKLNAVSFTHSLKAPGFNPAPIK
jgi:hypothetical protein